jgi:hypothetical protein
MPGPDQRLGPCPLCEGNGQVPPTHVVTLLRMLARRMLGMPKPELYRLKDGRVVEVRLLSPDETASLGSRTLGELPTWQL